MGGCSFRIGDQTQRVSVPTPPPSTGIVAVYQTGTREYTVSPWCVHITCWPRTFTIRLFLDVGYHYTLLTGDLAGEVQYKLTQRIKLNVPYTFPSTLYFKKF